MQLHVNILLTTTMH